MHAYAIPCCFSVPVVAADCAVTFSLAPKYPPPAHNGRIRDNGLMMAKLKMAPNMDAPNVQPILRPKYVLDAATCMSISL